MASTSSVPLKIDSGIVNVKPETTCIEIKVKDDPDIKDDPDPAPASANTNDNGPLVKIKKEEVDHEKVEIIDVPEASGADAMFADVDDAEVVDLTYEGIAEIDGVDHFVCEDFKIPQIPKPTIITRPLKSLQENIESGHIILDPDYQREVVWDEGRASLLITSILMGYFIPPIIFNVKPSFVEIDGKRQVAYTRVCVDGKQRLTSVYKFMTGQIGFFDSNSPQKKWYYCHPTYYGLETVSNHNILPKAVKEFFTSQAFCCYEYTELKLETEETMFQLVQRGIALTPAEKMRAMSTEWATFTKQYEDDYVLIVNLAKQTRASGFRLVLTIFTMIQEVMSGKRKRSAAPTLQASPQSLLKVLEDKHPIADSLKLKFKSIFDKYENLVKASSTQITATRFKVKNNSAFDPAPDFLREPGVEHVRTFSPLELIATAILVSTHMHNRKEEDLIEDVKAMRYYLRWRHKDLRVNAQCWFTVWEFVYEEMALRRGVKSLPSNPKDTTSAPAGQAIAPAAPKYVYASPYAPTAVREAAASGSTTPAAEDSSRHRRSRHSGSDSSGLSSPASTPEPSEDEEGMFTGDDEDDFIPVTLGLPPPLKGKATPKPTKNGPASKREGKSSSIAVVISALSASKRSRGNSKSSPPPKKSKKKA